MMAAASKSNNLRDSDDFTISSATEPDGSDEESSPELFGAGDNIKSRHSSGGLSGDRRQLLHDLQMAKIELSQKSMAYENLKAEAMSKEEELQERLQDLLQQKQLLQNKLENEMTIQRDESRRRQQQIQTELESAITKMRSIEEANARLVARTSDVKRLLDGDVMLDEQTYSDLKSKSEGDMGIREFLLLRIHEIVKPLKREIHLLSQEKSELESSRSAILNECQNVSHLLKEEREMNQNLQAEYQQCIDKLGSTKAEVQHGNYKIENFDRLSDERDSLLNQVTDFKEQLSKYEVDEVTLTREKEDLIKEVAALKQSNTMLAQDKDYLAKQVVELGSRASFAEDRLQSLTRQLDDTKQAREDLYEKYVTSREDYKQTYENRMTDELSTLRAKTEQETDRIKNGLRELYEKENRALCDQRDSAISERDRLAAEVRDLASTAEQLRLEFAEARIVWESREGELVCQSKLRACESERASILCDEMSGRVKKVELDIDKLTAKLEASTKEYYQLETSTNRTIGELEAQLKDAQSRLSTYEGLEEDLDSAVIQAAEVGEDDATSADRMLFAYGQGAKLPGESRRRMQQSVQLARKVLQLEKKCRDLCNQLEVKENENKDMSDEVARISSILSEAQQPYSYLVETLKSRDKQIRKLEKEKSDFQTQLKQCLVDRNNMAKIKNQMSSDLERLLSQREELTMLRKLFESMKMGQTGRAGNGVAMEKKYPALKSQDHRVIVKEQDNRPEYGTSYS